MYYRYSIEIDTLLAFQICHKINVLIGITHFDIIVFFSTFSVHKV